MVTAGARSPLPIIIDPRVIPAPIQLKRLLQAIPFPSLRSPPRRKQAKSLRPPLPQGQVALSFRVVATMSTPFPGVLVPVPSVMFSVEVSTFLFCPSLSK